MLLIPRKHRRIYTVLLLMLAWHKRRSLPGLLVYILTVSLPLRIAQRLLKVCQAPPQLDTLTASILHAVHWISEGSMHEVRKLLAVIDWIHGCKARWAGAKMKAVSGEDGSSVCGIWIAEEWRDLENERLQENVVLLYIHGGAYCFGGAEYGAPHHLHLIKRFNALEQKTGSNKRLVVFSLEYPLAPEHVFPAQIPVAATAFKWLVNSLGVSQVVVGGDSAGAHMTLSLMNHIKDTPELSKLPIQPLATILISPWVSSPSSARESLCFDLISVHGIQQADRLVFGHLPEKTNSLLTALQPDDFHVATKGTLVLYGGAGILSEGIEQFVGMLESRSEAVPGLEVVKYNGMPHCFNVMMMDRLYPSVRETALEAVEKTAAFIQRVSA
ncbi:Alpha/Beta hydrolase protein [Chytriomyces cf. hyalinus JEL632]|nr:Alpha/Beta hydrolase protein [Chytriomyces cf. hyalinus JEL632]